MIVAIEDAAGPSLFAHTLRKDWGVGVLAAESDGKRRYLFEDGEERSFTPDFYQLLRRVDEPTEQQRAAHTRLRGALAKRRLKDGTAGPKTPSEAFSEQLVKLHETYPGGFADPRWLTSLRGEGASARTAQHREPVIEAARQQLSAAALDVFLNAKQFSKLWDQLVGVLQATDLVPAAQLKLKPAAGEPERLLALAIRDLLHGVGPYYQRFDRYLTTFQSAFGQHAKWELATAPSAILHPKEHVCVDLTTFRSQLKLNNVNRAISTQPSSAGYTTFLTNVQIISNKLTERGDVPRDFFDVRDFIVFTLKPGPRAPTTAASRAKAPARKKAAPKKTDEDESVSED